MKEKAVLTEREMEELLEERGINIYDDSPERLLDSILVVEEAMSLGYTPFVDDETQTLIFKKKGETKMKKVYILTKASNVDYSLGVELEVFSTHEEALKAWDIAVKEDKEYAEEKCTIEESSGDYLAYVDGYAGSTSMAIYIEEKEVK